MRATSADEGNLRGNVVPKFDVVDEVAAQLPLAVVPHRFAVTLDELPGILLGETLLYRRLEDYAPAHDGTSIASHGLLDLLQWHSGLLEGDHVGEHALRDHPEHLVPTYWVACLVCIAADWSSSLQFRPQPQSDDAPPAYSDCCALHESIDYHGHIHSG
jgi:hypothetical protein